MTVYSTLTTNELLRVADRSDQIVKELCMRLEKEQDNLKGLATEIHNLLDEFTGIVIPQAS